MDSGNLAGHLLTLGAGLRGLADEKIFTPQVFAGLRDTVGVFRTVARDQAGLAELDADLATAPAGLSAALALLKRATDRATQIATALAAGEGDATRWAHTLRRQCEEQMAELLTLAPWLTLSATGPGETLDRAPTLRELSTFDQALSPEREQAGPELARGLHDASEQARQRLLTLETLARQSDELAAMDFSFLFDPARDLFCHRLQCHRTPA